MYLNKSSHIIYKMFINCISISFLIVLVTSQIIAIGEELGLLQSGLTSVEHVQNLLRL